MCAKGEINQALICIIKSIYFWKNIYNWFRLPFLWILLVQVIKLSEECPICVQHKGNQGFKLSARRDLQFDYYPWEREPVPHQMCRSYTKYTSWYSAWSISQMAPGLKYKTIWKWCKCNPLYLYEDTDNVHSAPRYIKDFISILGCGICHL